MATEKKVPAEIEKGITEFDSTKLKHADTVEKNPLPTPDSEYEVSTL